MGLFVKKNHGTEYLYSLAGKKQFFLGRKDNQRSTNQENLCKALSIIDKNFDRQIEKYLNDFNGHVSYMEENYRKKYVFKRRNNLSIKLKPITNHKRKLFVKK